MIPCHLPFRSARWRPTIRTNRLARLRYWPPAVYTEHLTAAWRRSNPAPATTAVHLPPPVQRARDPRVGVVCHVFYPELLDELSDVLDHLPPGTDVYASVVSDEHRVAVAERLAGSQLGRVEVRVVPNRGRDIAPKYVAFADVYDHGYDLLLFLHTKKTTVSEVGGGWREHLYSAVAGSPDRVSSILELFRADPGLGVLAPQHFGSISANIGWHGSFPHAARVARRAGFHVERWDPPDFPSGSMFWARPAALRPLVDLRLREEEFPREAGQNAYTVMHALERLVFVSAASAGFRFAVILEDDASPRTTAAAAMPARGRPGIRMRVGALPPAVREIRTEAVKRRAKLQPARVRGWLRRTLRPASHQQS